MKRWLAAGAGLLLAAGAWAQRLELPKPPPKPPLRPLLSLRVTALLFPLTPLCTLEGRVTGRFSLQGETNFRHIHGLNAKWYVQEPMRRGYVLLGTAVVRSAELREDQKAVLLPYIGYGYAWALGRRWTLDGRAGIGPTLGADSPGIYPVLKIGLGPTFYR